MTTPANGDSVTRRNVVNLLGWALVFVLYAAAAAFIFGGLR